MRLQMQGDLESARSLFGEASLSNGAAAGAGGKTNGGAALAALLDDGSNPLAAHADAKTKADFDAFSEALAKELIETHGSKPLYAHFAESLIRALAVPLKDLDVKKCASTLTALGNEKQAAAKAGTGKKGGKGKGKPQLGTVSGAGGGAKTAVTGRGCVASLMLYVGITIG
jgi:translation initiation factor 3 subunit J